MCQENQDVLCVQKIKMFYVSRKSRVSMCPENLIFCLDLVMDANVYYKQWQQDYECSDVRIVSSQNKPILKVCIP